MADIDGAKLRWGDAASNAIIGTPRPGTFTGGFDGTVDPSDFGNNFRF
jgi:hypothetical protein